ncbi:MAG: V-type ATP synthase subunit E [Ruminiclostridium sp.]|nr:V-type ATP synthase subunit E [Ruminiclostridium sp.]
MLEEQKRAERLGQIIIEDAKRIAEEIIENARKESEAIVEKAQEKYKHDEEEDILQDRHDTGIIYAKELSHRDFEARKEVLAFRNQKVTELFEGISNRILQYTDTDAYTEKLKSLVAKAEKEIPLYSECVIYHSTKDADKLKQALGDRKVKTQAGRNVQLGGILVYYPDENIYLDYTFDTSLEAQRREFANHSELSL